MLTDLETWFKAHLISLALIVSLTLGGIYGIESIIAKHDAAKSQEYSQLASQIQQSNAQFQQSVNSQLSNLAAERAADKAEIAALTAALTSRAKVEQKIPQTVSSLTVQQVATQLGGTANDNLVELPLVPAQKALEALLLVPQLQADKADLVQVNATCNAGLANAEQALSIETAAHASDNTANAATVKALNAEIVSVKAQARKSKIKWFAIGFVSGYIAGKLTL